MRHNGFELHSGALDADAQAALIAEVMAAVERAPFYEPRTPWEKPMSALQTSLGPLGWITDTKGYRYEPRHPTTGEPWPDMPQSLLALWDRYADPAHPPDSCLVNLYRGDAKMGLHQDSDEAFLDAPVLGISLGDTALFRLGGPARRDPTISFKLTPSSCPAAAGST
jgi:alkylated DNA repair protein (DNA oxidative demethylase)